MSRPITWLCLVLSLGAGLFLYQAKHQAQLLDRQIAQVMKAADAARARSAMLQTEYQVFSNSEHLADLAGSRLGLRPTAPGQFSTWADLERRLPPVGRPDDASSDNLVASLDDLPVPPIPPATIPPTAGPVAVAQISTIQPAAFQAVPPSSAASVSRMAAASSPPQAPARPAARLAALPNPVVTPFVSSVLAGRQPYRAQTYGAAPYGAQPYGAAPYGAAPYGAAGGQQIGSSLGMARPFQFPSAISTANAAGSGGGGNQ